MSHHSPPNKYTEILWGVINCVPTAIIAIVMKESAAFAADVNFAKLCWLFAVIVSFAFVFAVNSSIHSFLVVKYAKADKVAVSVGFYYMSNAMGRLFGTLCSGLVYTYTGENMGRSTGTDGTASLAACFSARTLSSVLAAGITFLINDDDAGLRCGSCITCVEPKDEEMDVLRVSVVLRQLNVVVVICFI